MSTFIVRIELHPSDKDQAHSAVHASMEAAGFSRVYRADDGIRYHLPSFEYCWTANSSIEAVRSLVQAAVAKVSSHFMVVVCESTRIAVAGLVPVKDIARVGDAPPVVTVSTVAKAA